MACNAGIRDNRLLRRLLATEPELVLPRLTVDGGPVIELGRDYVADFIRRLQAEGTLPAYDAEPVAELLARGAVSMALTTPTTIPTEPGEAARRFVRDHIAPLLGLTKPFSH